MSKKKKKNNYVDNERLCAEITWFRNAYKTDPNTQIPEYIGEAFYAIANRISMLPDFANYSYRDEMVGDAVYTCLRYVRTFDPAKGTNPFAYFSRAIYNAFLRRAEAEYKEAYILNRSFVEFYDDNAELLVDDDAMQDRETNMSQRLQAIERMIVFESSKARKKAKQKAKKGDRDSDEQDAAAGADEILDSRTGE